MKPIIHLKSRHELHIARKVWHISAGLFGLWVYIFSGVSQTGAIAILSSFLAFSIGMELLRLRYQSVNEWSQKVLGLIMRKHELTQVSGVPYFVAASLIAIIIFPKPISILAILYLTLGDPTASVFGILYGHHSVRFPNGKSLVGAVASGVICMAVSFPILNHYGTPFPEIIPMAVCGGVAASCAEVFPNKFDDNFVIPLVSGAALWLSALVFGVSF